MAEGQAYVASLQAGTAETYTSGGLLFGSQPAAQSWADRNPIMVPQRPVSGIEHGTEGSVLFGGTGPQTVGDITLSSQGSIVGISKFAFLRFIPAPAGFLTSVPARVIGGGVLGLAGSLSRGETDIVTVSENVALSAGSFTVLPFVFSKVGDLFGYIRTSYGTRPLPENELPILSKLKTPPELGEPESSATPYQLVRVGSKGYTNVFVEQTSEGLGIKTETDILGSSLLSERDLAQLVQGRGPAFIAGLEARAPEKLPSAAISPENEVKFFTDLGKPTGETPSALAKARADEIRSSLETYDKDVANMEANYGRRQQTIVVPKEIVAEAVSEKQDSISAAIQEARNQAEVRYALVRAIARGQVESESYQILAYPPGTRAPSLARAGEAASLASLTRVGMVSGIGIIGEQASKTGQSQATLQSLVSVSGLSEAAGTRTAQATAEELSSIQGLRLELSQVPQSPYLTIPQTVSEAKRRKKTRRKKSYLDYTLRNMLALNILESFGDVGSLFEGPPRKGRRSDFEEMLGI